MTPTEFRLALAALGLSQRGAAKLWGINERTVRTWAKKGPPQLVASLLGELVYYIAIEGDRELEQY